MRPTWLVLLPLLLGLAACSPQPDAVRLEEGWILEAPAGAPSMAGYGILANGTGEVVVVTGVESPAFARVHLHETRVTNGQARMAPVDRLTLPAGGRAVMRPGALHLMLMRPKEPLAAGDTAEVRFLFENGDALVASLPVRAAPPGG